MLVQPFAIRLVIASFSLRYTSKKVPPNLIDSQSCVSSPEAGEAIKPASQEKAPRNGPTVRPERSVSAGDEHVDPPQFSIRTNHRTLRDRGAGERFRVVLGGSPETYPLGLKPDGVDHACWRASASANPTTSTTALLLVVVSSSSWIIRNRLPSGKTS